MEDDNTTVTDVPVDTGAEEALPVEQEQSDSAAEQSTTEPSESTEESVSEDETTSTDTAQIDDKLRKYAASQGLELDSPSAIKAATIAMKAQSEATRNHRKASELEKTVKSVSDTDAEQEAVSTGQDPELLKTVRGLQVKDQVRDFWSQDGVDQAFEPKMVEILAEKPYLAGDLEALYATAVMKSGGVAAIKSQTKRETLESLAHKQQAAVPTGSATTKATPKAKPFAELSIAEMEKQLGMHRV